VQPPRDRGRATRWWSRPSFCPPCECSRARQGAPLLGRNSPTPLDSRGAGLYRNRPAPARRQLQCSRSAAHPGDARQVLPQCDFSHRPHLTMKR
jgi:hypothetical protein